MKNKSIQAIFLLTCAASILCGTVYGLRSTEKARMKEKITYQTAKSAKNVAAQVGKGFGK